jgi:Flp pilus assembly protein TadG
MKSKFRFLSLLSRLGKDKNAPGPRLLARLLRDEEGSYLILGALTFPILIGVAGLATEGGLVFYNHRALQNAADAAAYSAAIAYSYDSNADVTTQARAIVANYGFTLGTGTNQANVTATATTFDTQPAIVVNISRPQTAIFSSMFSSSIDFPVEPVIRSTLLR